MADDDDVPASGFHINSAFAILFCVRCGYYIVGDGRGNSTESLPQFYNCVVLCIVITTLNFPANSYDVRVFMLSTSLSNILIPKFPRRKIMIISNRPYILVL